jgi:hypothetical protein
MHAPAFVARPKLLIKKNSHRQHASISMPPLHALNPNQHEHL